MPMNRSLYPADWRDIATRVKVACRWRCEACDHPHAPLLGRALTVHHLDFDPRHNWPENLAALCQVCHMRIHAHEDRYDPNATIIPPRSRVLWVGAVDSAWRDWWHGRVRRYLAAKRRIQRRSGKRIRTLHRETRETARMYRAERARPKGAPLFDVTPANGAGR